MNENPEPAGEWSARIIPFQRRSAQPPDPQPRDSRPAEPVASRETAKDWLARIRADLDAIPDRKQPGHRDPDPESGQS